MSTPATLPAPGRTAEVSALRKGPNAAVIIGWSIVLLAIAYFTVRNVPRYFVFTPASYGSYLWAKVSWLFPHVACGLLALVLGPLQFWPRIRRDYLSFHRIAGRVYVVGVLVGSIAAFGMIATMPQNIPFAVSLAGLAIAWLITTGLAFVAILRRNIPQHRQWMIRSYVVTFAFVTFRLVSDLIGALHILPNKDRQAIVGWACWAIPLLITEAVLQGGAIFSSQRNGSRPAAVSSPSPVQ